MSGTRGRFPLTPTITDVSGLNGITTIRGIFRGKGLLLLTTNGGGLPLLQSGKGVIMLPFARLFVMNHHIYGTGRVPSAPQRGMTTTLGVSTTLFVHTRGNNGHHPSTQFFYGCGFRELSSSYSIYSISAASISSSSSSGSESSELLLPFTTSFLNFGVLG